MVVYKVKIRSRIAEDGTQIGDRRKGCMKDRCED